MYPTPTYLIGSALATVLPHTSAVISVTPIPFHLTPTSKNSSLPSVSSTTWNYFGNHPSPQLNNLPSSSSPSWSSNSPLTPPSKSHHQSYPLTALPTVCRSSSPMTSTSSPDNQPATFAHHRSLSVQTHRTTPPTNKNPCSQLDPSPREPLLSCA